MDPSFSLDAMGQSSEEGAVVWVGNVSDMMFKQAITTRFEKEFPIPLLYEISIRTRLDIDAKYIITVLRWPIAQDHEYNYGFLKIAHNDQHVIILTEDLPHSTLKTLFDSIPRPIKTTSIIQTLLKSLVKMYVGMTKLLDEDLDGLEDTIFQNKAIQMQEKLAGLRRLVVEARRHCYAEHEVLFDVVEEKEMHQGLPLFKIYESVSYDFKRFVERLDSMRERAVILQESLLMRTQSQLNSKLYVISVITALFMPLAFLTSLLGINVGGLPGAHDTHGFSIESILLEG